jgi:hypothetical protein
MANPWRSVPHQIHTPDRRAGLHPEGNDPIPVMPRRVLVPHAGSAQVALPRGEVASGRHRGTIVLIVLMVADTTLTMDAMLAHSVATWDRGQPP